MKKSIMRTILILGALILGMNVWVEKNFQSNFIYYSHNLSHPKDQYPFIGILMDYVVERGSVLLDDEMFLGLSSDKDGFSELYDIYYKDLKISNTGYKGKDLSKPSYVIVYKNQVFELNIKTEIIEKELSPDNYDLASLNNVLSNFGEQMLQQSSIPIFNLQWLFNIKYSERFH